VQTFPQELAAAVQQAREEAIRAAQHTAKVRADLLEKEEAANIKVHEAEMQTLHDTISQQKTQIGALAADLKAALKQVQELSTKVIGGPARTGCAAAVPREGRSGDGAYGLDGCFHRRDDIANIQGVEDEGIDKRDVSQRCIAS
jgi:hypothetical protein